MIMRLKFNLVNMFDFNILAQVVFKLNMYSLVLELHKQERSLIILL